MPSQRITITLPAHLVRQIDSRTHNRSSFILEAVRREIERRRTEALRKSLDSPHPQSQTLSGQGLEDWADALPADDVDEMLDGDSGRDVSWSPTRGWVQQDGS